MHYIREDSRKVYPVTPLSLISEDFSIREGRGRGDRMLTRQNCVIAQKNRVNLLYFEEMSISLHSTKI